MLRTWQLLALSVALLVSPALAADKADKSGKDQAQARRLQQQLRATEQEKAQLAQQLAQLKTESESLVRDAQVRALGVQRQADGLAGRVAALNKELQSVKARYESISAEKEALAAASKSDQAALAARLAEMERKLAEQQSAHEREKQQFEAVLAKGKAAISGCHAHNDNLYKLGNELLDHYEKKTCMASLLQAEPFTGLKRAQIEKLVEAYREKLDKDQWIVAPEIGKAAPER